MADAQRSQHDAPTAMRCVYETCTDLCQETCTLYNVPIQYHQRDYGHVTWWPVATAAARRRRSSSKAVIVPKIRRPRWFNC